MTAPTSSDYPERPKCATYDRMTKLVNFFCFTSIAFLIARLLTNKTAVPDMLRTGLLIAAYTFGGIALLLWIAAYLHQRRCEVCETVKLSGAFTSPKKHDQLMRLGRLGHHMRWASVTVFAAFAVLAMLPSETTPVSIGRNVAFIALIATISPMHIHMTTGCSTCNNMPLNAASLADRRTTTIRIWHRVIEDKRSQWIILITGLILIVGGLALGKVWGEPINIMTIGIILGYTITMDVVHRRHSQIIPWCPRCHPGHGNDDEDVVDPVPQPAGTA